MRYLTSVSLAPLRMRAFAAVVISAVLLAPISLAAQAASPLTGKWSIEWESGRRMENGETTIIKSTGDLEISAAGDSLVATVTARSRTDGMAPPKPFTMAGKRTAVGAQFKQTSSVTINMNGEERQQTVTSTWTLIANGDELQGTLSRELPGMPMSPEPAPITGKRAR